MDFKKVFIKFKLIKYYIIINLNNIIKNYFIKY